MSYSAQMISFRPFLALLSVVRGGHLQVDALCVEAPDVGSDAQPLSSGLIFALHDSLHFLSLSLHDLPPFGLISLTGHFADVPLSRLNKL